MVHYCSNRGGQKNCHLTLPYYRMSGLSVTEIMARNRSSPHSYGLGFLFYLKRFLIEETGQPLTQVRRNDTSRCQFVYITVVLCPQEAADEVIDIFSQSEPSELIRVCASPSMINVSPARTLEILRRLEDTAGVSVLLTITMATILLRLDDLPQFRQLMHRHTEVTGVK